MDKLIQTRIRQITDCKQRIGATYVPDQGVYIRLWAPFYQTVEIEWLADCRRPLQRTENGYHTGFFPKAKAGDRYYFHANQKRLPDPASRYQPEGVFGPSQVVGNDFEWRDENWTGIPYSEWVIYEIHTGAYSASHDFSGIIGDLPRLKDLGITTLEIMPVAQFSGARNWGYDGVFPHAVQNTYGGPSELKRLVDACHMHGLSIILDVVYNHLGQEGNVLSEYGPYTNDKYRTPWNDAINFDAEENDHIRRYYLQAAYQWLVEYHFDGLRIDAVQMIFDNSETPFLAELSRLKTEVESHAGRPLVLIGESDMNDPAILKSTDRQGLGFDAQWADDFHHALHVALTGEQKGYYQDYNGAEQLARIYQQGVLFQGEYSVYRKRLYGYSYRGIDKKRLIVESQNHDQVGNRSGGERLSMLVDFEKLKLAAACVLLSPFTPLIFMGEDWASKKPFLFFVDYCDSRLIEKVKAGRMVEWKSFGWINDPLDPSSLKTFEKCVLGDKIFSEEEAFMQNYYRTLICLSKEVRKHKTNACYDAKMNLITLSAPHFKILFSFNEMKKNYKLEEGQWRCIFSSTGKEGTGENKKYDEVDLEPYSAMLLWRCL